MRVVGISAARVDRHICRANGGKSGGSGREAFYFRTEGGINTQTVTLGEFSWAPLTSEISALEKLEA